MVYEEPFAKTMHYIRERWYEREAFREQPQLALMNRWDREDLRDIFPPIKEGITLDDLTCGAERIAEIDALDRVRHHIPDSSTIEVVEFCSHSGIRGSYKFAQDHPHTRVLLVDKLDNDALGPGLHTKEFVNQLANLGKSVRKINDIVYGRGFHRYDTPVSLDGDVPTIMRRLFDANGVPNMAYTHQFLTRDPEELRPHLTPGKRRFCIGWYCPSDAGIWALKHAVHYEAEAIAISISALEHCTHQRALSSNPAMCDLPVLFPRARAKPNHDRYHQPFMYKDLRQKRAGFAHKHAQILDALEWLEEQGYTTRLTLIDHNKPISYNTPEHFIRAWKRNDILALPVDGEF